MRSLGNRKRNRRMTESVARGVSVVFILLLTACGGPAPESSTPDAPVGEEGLERGVALGATRPMRTTKPVTLSDSTSEQIDPAEAFDVVSDLWVELDGEYARVKFTIELENRSSDIKGPTFVSIEEHNWIEQRGQKKDVGGGTIGIRRPLELAPGERKFMNRGDFTTLGSGEFLKGTYGGAGMSGVIRLQDERGRPFELPFEYAEKFSIDAEGRPMSEFWANSPEGEVMIRESARNSSAATAAEEVDGFERLPEPAPL